MKHELSKERLTDEELSQIAFYAGEAICHPDPNYALEFEKLAHPANVLALANEVVASRALLAAHEQEPVAYAVFSNSGNIRIWSTVKSVCDVVGGTVPLYTHPAPVPEVQPVMFIDGDISSEDADKLAKVIREFNEEDERPLAKMARIIRENPQPTNECDMPRSAPVPAVPDDWRNSLQELLKAMRDYEMDVGEPAPYKHREMMRRAEALLNGGKS